MVENEEELTEKILKDGVPPILGKGLPTNNPNFDPYHSFPYEGAVAICSFGSVGLIEGRAWTKYNKWMWVGKRIDGTPWASGHPRLIRKEDGELLKTLFKHAISNQ